MPNQNEHKNRDRPEAPPGPKAEPPLNRPARLVDCGTFRCMAYQDEQGKWRDLRGNELTVLRVLSEL